MRDNRIAVPVAAQAQSQCQHVKLYLVESSHANWDPGLSAGFDRQRKLSVLSATSFFFVAFAFLVAALSHSLPREHDIFGCTAASGDCGLLALLVGPFSLPLAPFNLRVHCGMHCCKRVAQAAPTKSKWTSILAKEDQLPVR